MLCGTQVGWTEMYTLKCKSCDVSVFAGVCACVYVCVTVCVCMCHRMRKISITIERVDEL